MQKTKMRLKTAGKVQKEWKKTVVKDRIHLVGKAMDYFRANLESIARDITLQIGKPINQSRNESTDQSIKPPSPSIKQLINGSN